MSKLVKLDCGVQHYAWGKPANESAVAKAKGLSGDTSGKKYAELWVGTHPSCPSRLLDKTTQLFDDYLKQGTNNAAYFSLEHQKSPFQGNVPFLLKILSIETALSIQAHPSKALAERLHAERPDKYKDPNHKPELLCALTPFEALCCFRSLGSIIHFLSAIPELARLVSASDALGSLYISPSAVMPVANSPQEKKLLKRLMETLYTVDTETCTAALRAHLTRLQNASSASCKEDQLFVRVYNQYPDDVGCWMVYFLNYVRLNPGEALFLSDSEPHAYISGDGVEIMACSDNVVRAGLTPKWKDVGTLVNMLKYDTSGLARAFYPRKADMVQDHWEIQYYQPPPEFLDFSLYRCEYNHESASGTARVPLPTIGLGFCLEGSVIINSVHVNAGDSFAVPHGDFICEAKGRRALVFVASTNILANSPSKL